MGQATDAVSAVLSEMAARYGAKDADGVLELFAGNESVVVGTGIDEVRFGLAEIRAQLERDMAQAESLSLHFDDLRVNDLGYVALAYADAAFVGSVGGEELRLPVRLTLALVRTGDDWRFAQFHSSVAFGEQAAGESYPA